MSLRELLASSGWRIEVSNEKADAILEALLDRYPHIFDGYAPGSGPREVPTFDELYDLGKTVALLRSDRLSDASFRQGFLLDVLTGMSAAQLQEVMRFAIALHARTFVRTATGDALDELARDHWDLPRYGPARAVGRVTFSRATTAAGNVMIPTGTRVATADGLAFQTRYGVPLEATSILVDVEAVEPGLAGIVAAGAITVIESPLTDPSLGVSNAVRTAGGADAETDEAYRARVLGHLAVVRRGTARAVAHGAKIPGVMKATLDETADPPIVYIADAWNGANEQLAAAVEEALREWQVAGVSFVARGASSIDLDIHVELTVSADESVDRDAIIDSILAEMGRLEIGATLFRSAIMAAAHLPGVLDVNVIAPAQDAVGLAGWLFATRRELIVIG